MASRRVGKWRVASSEDSADDGEEFGWSKGTLPHVAGKIQKRPGLLRSGEERTHVPPGKAGPAEAGEKYLGRGEGEFDTAADGVDAFGADADAVAEFPDVAAVRTSSAGLFLFPRLG